MEHSKTRAYRWLDLRALATRFLLPGETLEGVTYFTAIAPWSKAKADKHRRYIAALKHFGVEVEEGRFQKDERLCLADCGQLFSYHVEKLTDVNISTRMVRDAVLDRFDRAMLVTGDSDQTPTIRAIRDLAPTKQVVLLFPPRRFSADLQGAAHDVVASLGERDLKACQLPARIEAPGRIIEKPSNW